jgi:hypothetical protein
MSRFRRALAAIVATTIGGLHVHDQVAAQSVNVSKDRLLAAAAAYVGTYQKEFAFLLADETTEQRSFGIRNKDKLLLRSRTTKGEIFITYLAGERHWVTVRDVAEVDGRPVADRPDLPALLSLEDPHTVASRLFSLNARYNIGGVIRNFNDPMLPLLTVSDAHRSRFAFDVQKTERLAEGVVLATLAFRERERPTLVRPEGGGVAFSRGTITSDASTGVVRRTLFTLRHDSTNAELVTEFSHHDRLGLWVPSSFTERYTNAVDDLTDEAVVSSTYTNFRRFEARGRIERVGPPSDP